MRFIPTAALCAAAFQLIHPNATAATFSADFNSGTPAGLTLYGTAVIEPTGGVANSGVLKITKAVGGQSGGAVLEDIDAGSPIYGFDMRFKARVGGGTATPADGFSVNFGSDIPDGAFGEEGVGSGVRVAFDLYDNGGGEAPSIDIKVGDTVLATRRLTIPEIISPGTDLVDVHINFQPSGLMSVAYKGSVIHTNIPVAGYVATAGRFGFGGRTGGSTANQWIDDLQITTFLQPQIAFAQQPRSITALLSRDATFEAQITNPDGATFQWFRNGTAIVGATSATLVVPDVAATDSGARFRVQVTGPSNNISSEEATLTVVDIPSPALPKISFDFNDATTPAGSTPLGLALVDATGGVNDSGVLKLTINENDQAGAFAIDDPDAGATVYGFTARFDVRAGGGTAPPADGFSFNLSTNVPDPLPGELEEGLGNGLTVAFDIYNGAASPTIDVKYNNAVVATANVPLSFLETGDIYAEALIRMEADGTIDVAYDGVLVHSNVVVTGFTSIAGGKYVLGARTGGLNANYWIDNLQISTLLTAGDLRIATQPSSITALVGRAATFSAEVNDPAGVSYQWLRNGTPVVGATSSTYTIPATVAADNNASFQLRVTRGNLTVTSSAATLTVIDLAAPAVPTINLDFNNGLVPAGSAVFGTAFVDATGGVADSGVLKVTINENGQSGGYVIAPLLAGAELSGFTAAFDLRLGGGTGNAADGLSFNFGANLPDGTLGDAEEGAGIGLTITFDIYDNGGGEAPAIEVKWNGQMIGQTKLTKAEIETGDEFRPVLVRLSQDGKVDLSYGDRVLQSGLQITNYTLVANGEFGFYARTGGENENQWVDNIRILAVKSVAPLRFTTEPADVAVLASSNITFTATVSDPTGVTYQWLRNGLPITGATSASFTTAALAAGDSGARYSVVATGPGGIVTSREAVVTVVSRITVTNPKVSFDFEDGLLPENSQNNGTAYFDAGVLKLTDAVNGQGGSFIIADRDGGAAISSLTAAFDVQVGGGTTPPADGFAFVWASDMDLTASFGEDGAGSGLVVSFDIYDNGGGEAPAIDIFYAGSVVATRKVPLSLLDTGGQFAPVVVRVEADGTLDLQYDGNVIYNNLALPGFTALAGGNFGFGGRTGGLNANQWVDNIQISTGTGATAPQMTITRTAGAISIGWTGAGTLQSRDSLSAGAWADVAGAANPYPAPNNASMRFFRVRAQ